MKDHDLSKVVSVEISLGHVLLAWETLSDKFSDLRSNAALSEEERSAIWGLADLLESALVTNGLGSMPHEVWESAVTASKEHIKTVTVDFLD
jgi:hypothetical protein